MIEREDIDSIFESALKGKVAPGIDRITKNVIKRNGLQAEIVDSIFQALNYGKPYAFTKYKQVLKVKKSDSFPRVIAVPSAKDRVMLKTIYEKNLKQFLTRKKISEIIKDIKADYDSGMFDSFLKSDISSFFDTIDQELLCEKLREIGVEGNAIKIIESALKTNTVSEKENNHEISKTIVRKKGIPQGIIISNALAEIYIQSLDVALNSIKGMKFYRFVDDVLILYDSKILSSRRVFNLLKNKTKKLKLKLNKLKKEKGKIADNDLTFIGFRFTPSHITLPLSVTRKKERKLERIVFDFKRAHSKSIKGNLSILEWKLNLDITGFVYKNRYYGWVNTYQAITDQSVLYHLNDVLIKILKRADIDVSAIRIKSFVKAYKCIINHDSKYLINFDKNYCDTALKKDFLTNTLKMNFKSDIEDETIESIFDEYIKYSIYEIERDLDFKYGQ